MKMKSARTFILAMALAVVLTCTHLLLLYTRPSGQPFSAAIDESAGTQTGVERIEVQTGDRAWICRLDASQGGESIFIEDYPEGFDFDDALLRDFAQKTANVSQFHAIAYDAAEEADYGFGAPAALVNLFFVGGGTEKLIVGSKTFLQDGYYVRLERGGEETVHIAPLSYIDALLGGPLYFRSAYVLPALGADEDSFVRSVAAVQWLPAEGDGFQIVAVPADDETHLAQALLQGQVVFWMVSPEHTHANVYNMDTLLLTRLYALASAPAWVVSDDAEDGASYGLDTPSTLTLITGYGERIDLLLGRADAERGVVYFQHADRTSTYAAPLESLVFLSQLDYFDLMNKTIWIHDSATVADITIADAQNRENTLMMDGRNKDAFSASLNGRPLAEAAARQLYLRFLSILIAGKVQEVVDISTPVYTVTMRLHSGQADVLRLYPLNYRQYAISLNDGEIRYYCNASDIADIFSAIEEMAATE